MKGMPGKPGQMHRARRDSRAAHTMIVLGTETIFLSHIPMFTTPHDYQVILRATFSSPGSDPQQVYVDDRKAHPAALLYTVQPEPFVLPDLFPSGPRKTAHLRSFPASLFRGNYAGSDADIAPIAESVVVSVADVVHSRKFDPGAPALDHLSYVLFGKGSELWLEHVLTKPPDFEQILSITVDGHGFTVQSLAAGIPVTVPGRANLAGQRIGRVPGDAAVDAVATAAGKSVPIRVQPQIQFYFNEISKMM